MPEVVGVRFKMAGKLSNFDTVGMALKVGDQVVVDAAHGLELGVVAVSPKQIEETTEPPKPILRLATPEDINQATQMLEKEREALVRCREAVSQLDLPMKLLLSLIHI